MSKSRNDQDNFHRLLVNLSAISAEHPASLNSLMHLTSDPIQSEKEVLERAEVMDKMMDMAKGKNDIFLIFARAIANCIEEFERDIVMPSTSAD